MKSRKPERGEINRHYWMELIYFLNLIKTSINLKFRNYESIHFNCMLLVCTKQLLRTNIKLPSHNDIETKVAYVDDPAIDKINEFNTVNRSVKTTGVNTAFLNSSLYTNNANFVNTVEHRISRFDVQNASGYNGDRKSKYDVVFFTEKGDLLVTYNHQGEIIASRARFVNIPLPRLVSMSIMNKYPSWIVDENVCLINYKQDKGRVTIYKTKISKDNQSKIIKTDEKGNII